MGQVVILDPQRLSPFDFERHQPHEIVRDRLLKLLGSADAAPATLLHAPAGYGKSVLLEHFEAFCRSRGETVELIQLEERFRDVALLSGRFATAFGDGAVGSGLIYLLVDGLERIAGSESENYLLRTAESLPRHVRMIIASRKCPDSGIARLRLSRKLAVLDAEVLKFTADEIMHFLTKLGADPLDDSVASLHRVSDGWPAAMGMVVAALHEGKAAFQSLIRSETTAWPLLRAYVSEEVIGSTSTEMRYFLLKTAPLQRFTRDLAVAVTGHDDIGDRISRMEELGIVARETHDYRALQVWYRYQPLIARCLELAFSEDDPDGLRDVHQSAMSWHRQFGRLSDATRHAFAAGDTDTAADLLKAASKERRRLGRISADTYWSKQLGSEEFDRHPDLHVAAACSFAARFELEAARAHLVNARQYFSDLDPVIRDDLYAVDAMIAVYGDHPELCVEVAERGLKDAENGDPYTLGTLRLIAASGWITRSSLDKAKALAMEALADNERAGSAFGIAIARTLSGLVDAVRGDLSSALASWKLGESAITSEGSDPAVEKIAIGYIPALLYEQNCIEEAQSYLDRCLIGPIEIVLPDMWTSIILSAARLAAIGGNAAHAKELLNHGEEVAAANNWPRLTSAIQWERLRMAVLSGSEDEARRHYAHVTAPDAFKEPNGIVTHALETEANTVGDLRFQAHFAPSPAVISQLRSTSKLALGANRILRATKLMVLEAVSRDILGDRSAAARTMRQALELGAAGGLIRTFIDEGPRALSLIRAVAETAGCNDDSIGRDYLARMLKAVGMAHPHTADEPVLVEALTRREREILRLVFDGMTNAEIAHRAIVSENTVKWHLQKVYSKLSVANRTGAVAAARALGIFE